MLTGLYDRSNIMAQQRHQEHVALAEQGQASFPHFARTNLCHTVAECGNMDIDQDTHSAYLNVSSPVYVATHCDFSWCFTAQLSLAYVESTRDVGICKT